MIDIELLARDLYHAEVQSKPIPLVKERFPELDWAQARAIARANDALCLDAGDLFLGYKLGWTSEAMRKALGVERPNWGTLWHRNVCDAHVSFDRFIHPKLEPELVFRSAEALEGQISADDVLAVAGEWALGIEVVDPRFPSFAFDALDNTADNSSRSGVRIGEFAPLSPAVLAEATVVLTGNTPNRSDESRTGPSTQAMGSPAEAVAWLVRQLHEEQLPLPAGAVVFTGGLTAPFDAEPGTTYHLACDVLDEVSLTFE